MVLGRSSGAEVMPGGSIPRASSKPDRLCHVCPELEWDNCSLESRATRPVVLDLQNVRSKKQNKFSRVCHLCSKVLQRVLWLLRSAAGCLAVLIVAILILSASIQNEKKDTENILEPEQHTWQLMLFRLLPARFLSRLWGFLMSMQVPESIRTSLYGLFVWKFNCNMAEAEIENLRDYCSLGELFTRKLKKEAREMSESKLVSPTDGKILHFGTVNDGLIEQVKGVTYKLQKFLGPEDSLIPYVKKNVSSNVLIKDEQKQLYHVIVYLGPGDYHHFHSPSDWTILKRRHFPGDLLSVAPWAARTIPGLFSINERAIVTGTWEHGFFSMVAVGAYNVGSISLTVDESLETNVEDEDLQLGEYRDKQLGEASEGIRVKKGERLGGFKLGSTVVLVFEAPSNFQFSILSGQKIQYGQSISTSMY